MYMTTGIKEEHMTTTIFDTPVIRPIVRWISIVFLRLNGWKTEGPLPDIPKFVLIAAPHTSNWDLPYMLFMAFRLKAKIYWMGKETLFSWPFGPLFRWLGGIPIDRSQANDVVAQSVEQFQKNEKRILTVPPAGTRKRVLNWKTGFYHIATGAGVPIALGFLDYKRKVGGIGRLVQPTGDIERDMEGIRAFYSDISGKHPLKSMAAAPSTV
jgi:1-acyl-sn-glycerol-3-phosphate acyltransferase